MGGRGTAIVTAAVAVVLSSAGSGAIAQPQGPVGDIERGAADSDPDKDPKVAKKWVAAGHQAMQKGSYFAARSCTDDAKVQFESAVLAFQKAIETGDDLSVYLELAAAEEKLGRLGTAIKHVRRLTDGQDVPPDVARRAVTKLDDLLSRVGLVTLKVVPDGTSITLGGSEVGTSPLAVPLVLMPGTYTLSFQAAGFQPREAELKIEPGSEIERTIELEPVNVFVGQLPGRGKAGAQPSPPRLPLYLGAAATGTAALSAGIFGLLAVSRHSTFTTPSTPMSDREDARNSGKRFALATDISIAATAAAAGFTLYWYIYKYRQHRDHPNNNSAKLGAIPWVQPESSGLAIAGRF